MSLPCRVYVLVYPSTLCLSVLLDESQGHATLLMPYRVIAKKDDLEQHLAVLKFWQRSCLERESILLDLFLWRVVQYPDFAFHRCDKTRRRQLVFSQPTRNTVWRKDSKQSPKQIPRRPCTQKQSRSPRAVRDSRHLVQVFFTEALIVMVCSSNVCTKQEAYISRQEQDSWQCQSRNPSGSRATYSGQGR